MKRRRYRGRLVASLLVSLAASTSTWALAESETSGKFEWTSDSAEAKELLGELQARIENFQQGAATIELAQKIVEADPDFAMGVYYLSAVTPPPEGLTHLEKAAELAERASDGERRFIEAMVEARANGGNFAAAVPLLEDLAEDYPKERLVPMILGQVYQIQGDAKKARAAFERALAIGPESNRARSFLANDDLLQGEYRRARNAFEEIQKDLPEGAAPAPIRYGLAFSYLYEGRDEEAVDELHAFVEEYRASGANQGFPEVFIWNSIARIHLENGRSAEAMKAYEKGYESVPDSNLPEDQKKIWYGRLKHGRCRTLAKLGRHDEAWQEAETVRKMIEEAGEDGEQFLPAYHYLAGYLKLESGDTEEALEHLKQANPNDPFHKLLLARALDRAGDRTSADSAYREILDSTNNGLERALAYPEAKRWLSRG